jgi:hypothetical protein
MSVGGTGKGMSGAHYHVGQGPRCGNMSKSVVRLAQLSGTAETTNQCVSMLFTIISSLEVIVGKIKLPDSSIDTHTYPCLLGRGVVMLKKRAVAHAAIVTVKRYQRNICCDIP